MIRVVAIDTSTWWGGVALVQGAEAEHRPSTIAEASGVVMAPWLAVIVIRSTGFLWGIG